MTITDRSDGRVALDWGRTGVPGPFIVLSKSQLAELAKALAGRELGKQWSRR